MESTTPLPWIFCKLREIVGCGVVHDLLGLFLKEWKVNSIVYNCLSLSVTTLEQMIKNIETKDGCGPEEGRLGSSLLKDSGESVSLPLLGAIVAVTVVLTERSNPTNIFSKFGGQIL